MGQSLCLDTDMTQREYPDDEAPLVSDYYDMEDCEDVALGQGSFGRCTRGVHLASNKRCAIKLMRKEVVGRHYIENFVERDMYTFLLKMARSEPHPNVIRHLDYLMGPTVIYGPMELLEGENLDVHLQTNSPVCEGFAQCIMRQVFAALKHIHFVAGIGLIHRDVKLENFRFRGQDATSDLVLLDFGLSCAARPDQKREVVGTLLYMAPEIFSTRYSTQVDLWSAGVSLYIIVMGKPPWKPQVQSTGMFAASRGLFNGAAGVKAALDPEQIQNAPRSAVDLLHKLLVVDPTARLTAAAASEHGWFSTEITSVSPGMHQLLSNTWPGPSCSLFRTCVHKCG